jgi:MYXO-CTERM domain-containing protein
MKTSLKFIAAAALVLASAGASAASNLSANLYGGGVFTAANGDFGGGSDYVTPGVWQIEFNSNSFLAYCIAPSVALTSSSNNYSAAAYVASDSVKRLYEAFYDVSVQNVSLVNNAGAQAFQLALWELKNDDANLLGGALQFDDLNYSVLAQANSMLGTALGNGAIANKYNYTSLTSVNPASQELLSVSPVPEAQTWAMLVAGLGLLGFMRRRKA